MNIQKVETTLTGCPISQNKNSLTAGPRGPVLLEDPILQEKIQHFDREKIPARNVHALGTGAYGTFTVTHDITKYTCAKIFSRVGKVTNLFARMSGTFTEQGDPETFRDIRGFAMKFFTEEGNWDLLTINVPVFNVRDAKIGPDAIHSFKRDPRTSMWNPTQSWDFVANHPESLHLTTFMYSDKGGTPMSFRHMNAWAANTYSFINANKERHWIKFHLVGQQGMRGLDRFQAKQVASEDPNFLTRDLRDAIDRKEFPRWKLCCQVMREEEGYKHNWAFDATKIWKHSDYPLIEIGIVELNKNPVDYFAEVEQVAFSPRSVVPGIGFSPDKLLQGRLMIYEDTQYHRIGPNYKQLPINRPKTEINSNCSLGGSHNQEIKNHFPHYSGSCFGGYMTSNAVPDAPLKLDGAAGYYDYPGEGTDEDYYGQVRDLWTNVLDDTEKEHLCMNIALELYKVDEIVVKKVLPHFHKIDRRYGEMVERILLERKQGKHVTEPEETINKLRKCLAQG